MKRRTEDDEGQDFDEYDDEDEDDLDRAQDDEDQYEGEGRSTRAESESGVNLGKMKISQDDYARRAQSAKSSKKGKYGVTVPIPFKGNLMNDK